MPRGPIVAVAHDLPSIKALIHARALRSPGADMLPRIGMRGTMSLLSSFIRHSAISTRMPDTPLAKELRRMSMDMRAHDSGIQVAASGSLSGSEVRAARCCFSSECFLLPLTSPLLCLE